MSVGRAKFRLRAASRRWWSTWPNCAGSSVTLLRESRVRVAPPETRVICNAPRTVTLAGRRELRYTRATADFSAIRGTEWVRSWIACVTSMPSTRTSAKRTSTPVISEPPASWEIEIGSPAPKARPIRYATAFFRARSPASVVSKDTRNGWSAVGVGPISTSRMRVAGIHFRRCTTPLVSAMSDSKEPLARQDLQQRDPDVVVVVRGDHLLAAGQGGAQSLHQRAAKCGFVWRLARGRLDDQQLSVGRRRPDVRKREDQRVRELQPLDKTLSLCHGELSLLWTLQQAHVLEHGLQVAKIAPHANAAGDEGADGLLATLGDGPQDGRRPPHLDLRGPVAAAPVDARRASHALQRELFAGIGAVDDDAAVRARDRVADLAAEGQKRGLHGAGYSSFRRLRSLGLVSWSHRSLPSARPESLRPVRKNLPPSLRHDSLPRAQIGCR